MKINGENFGVPESSLRPFKWTVLRDLARRRRFAVSCYVLGV